MNGSNRRWVAIIVTFQVVILLSIWGMPGPRTAAAQLPDPAAQRERQIDELKAINSKLDKLIDILSAGELSTGKVQARVPTAEDK